MKMLLSLFLLCLFVSGQLIAQPGFSITLTVEHDIAYTAYHDEPLIFTTSLVNRALQQNMVWNQDADVWLKQVATDYKAGNLTKEEFEKETELVTKGKKPIKIDSVGNTQLPWFHQLQFRVFFKNGLEQSSWPISIGGDAETDCTAILDEQGYYIVKHHLSPRQVARLKAGTYKIQVLLAGVWSNEVLVQIRPGNMPNSLLRSKPMQLRLGNYYLQIKDAEKALTYANTILKINPLDISGLVLKGESFILQQKYQPALAVFQKASRLYNKNLSGINEPPVYLLATIAWLQKK